MDKYRTNLKFCTLALAFIKALEYTVTHKVGILLPSLLGGNYYDIKE